MLAKKLPPEGSLRSFFSIEPKKGPCIRGLFVNGHVAALRSQRGEEGVAELQRRFGRSVHFGPVESVPVRDEVAILELSLEITQGPASSHSQRSLDAGALHYQNFRRTTLGSALMRSLSHTPESFKTVLHNAPSIARIVFENTEFITQNIREGISLTITNCDYPIEHFQGFFEEWMRQWRIRGVVRGRAIDGSYEYLISLDDAS